MTETIEIKTFKLVKGCTCDEFIALATAAAVITMIYHYFKSYSTVRTEKMDSLMSSFLHQD